MGRRLKISSTRLTQAIDRSRLYALGIAAFSPAWRQKKPTSISVGTSTTLTSGPAAMLHRVAAGRGGGSTYATPPNGQRTMRSALPPTWRQASACPYSCVRTMRNSARYSRTFQTTVEYDLERALISYAATKNHDQ